MTLWLLWACSGAPLSPGNPAPAGEPPARLAQAPPDGPHLERWPDGSVAVEGRWTAGQKDGVWLHWGPDGAFRSRVTWQDGRQHGERIEVDRHGRLVRIELTEGAAVRLGSLPAGTPMPEWDAGQRVEGTRYATSTGG